METHSTGSEEAPHANRQGRQLFGNPRLIEGLRGLTNFTLQQSSVCSYGLQPKSLEEISLMGPHLPALKKSQRVAMLSLHSLQIGFFALLFIVIHIYILTFIFKNAIVDVF